MTVRFHEEAFIELFKFEGGEKTKPSGVKTSQTITGIELRLSKASIINNKTPRIGPFPGFAKIYLLLIVVSDHGDPVPFLDLKAFPKVGDDEDLPVDKTIYYWKQKEANDPSPSQIHVLTSIIKSKQELRDVGEVLKQIAQKPEYTTLTESLRNVTKNGSIATQVSDLLFSIAGVAGGFLGNVDDKPLLTWMQSFTDINGDFDKLGKTTLSRKNGYAELSLSIIIRDKYREEELSTLSNNPYQREQSNDNSELA